MSLEKYIEALKATVKEKEQDDPAEQSYRSQLLEFAKEPFRKQPLTLKATMWAIIAGIIVGALCC